MICETKDQLQKEYVINGQILKTQIFICAKSIMKIKTVNLPRVGIGGSFNAAKKY